MNDERSKGNINFNLIFSVLEEIKSDFSTIKVTSESSIEEKSSFSTTYTEHVKTIYSYLKLVEDSDIREKFGDSVDTLREIVDRYFRSFDSSDLEEALKHIETLESELDNYKINDANTESRVSEYTSKVSAYNETLKDYESCLLHYKQGKVSYEIVKAKYDVCLKEYQSLVNDYKDLNIETLSKPVRPRTITKNPEELRVDNFLKRVKTYNLMLDNYESNEYQTYLKISNEYLDGKISYEDYLRVISEISNLDRILRSTYEDLVKELDEIEKSYNINGDYTIASEEEINEYIKSVEEYERQVEIYEGKINELSILEEQLIKGLITEEEYHKKELEIEEIRIVLITDQKRLQKARKGIYNPSVLSGLYSQQKLLMISLTNKTLTEEQRKLLQAKYESITQKIAEIREFRSKITIKKFEGKKITKTGRKRGKPLDVKLTPPPNFTVLDENQPKKSFEYLDLDDLIEYLRNGDKYSKFDNFVYTYKNIKLFNYHKTNELTILDKPMKLTKAAISGVITAPAKLFANLAYHTKSRRQRIDSLIDRINKLTDNEVEYLIANLSYDNQKERFGTIPDIVWNALYSKLSSKINEKLKEGNIKLEEYYRKIIDDYNKAREIKQKLANPELSESEKASLQSQYDKLSLGLCETIIAYSDLKSELSNLVNAGGRYGLSENRRARRTLLTGGRNASSKDNPEEATLAGTIGKKIKEAMRAKDGYSAAEMFIYKEQVKIENTTVKHTLKNRGAKADVGAFHYNPLVTTADYSNSEYLQNVIQTAVIAISLANTVAQIKLASDISKLNTQIVAHNAEVTTMNNQVAQLKQIFNSGLPMDKQMEQYGLFIKERLAQLQGASEYYGAIAQAGNDGTMVWKPLGDIYNKFDDFIHQFTDAGSKSIDSILSNTSLTYEQQAQALGNVLSNASSEFTKIVLDHGPLISKYLQLCGNSENFGIITEMLNIVGKSDPTFMSGVMTDMVKAATVVNNMQALNYISTINTAVPTATSVATLAGILGYNLGDALKRRQQRTKEDETEEKAQELADLVMSTEIDSHEIALRNFEQDKATWDSKGPFYKLLHRKDKPKLVDYEYETAEGRSL